MATIAADPLAAWRDEFPLATRATHLIAHSLGAMPRRARARLAQYLDQWDGRGIRSWEDAWWMLPIEVGNEGPLVLVETRKDLSQVKLPFETQGSQPQG